jgi:hypothetical protein
VRYNPLVREFYKPYSTVKPYHQPKVNVEKSDDYKQGYVHALESQKENEGLKIKRLELHIKQLEAENRSLTDQILSMAALGFDE